MFDRGGQQCGGPIRTANLARSVAVGSQPCRGGLERPEVCPRPKGEAASEGQNMGVQTQRHQQARAAASAVCSPRPRLTRLSCANDTVARCVTRVKETAAAVAWSPMKGTWPCPISDSLSFFSPVVFVLPIPSPVGRLDSKPRLRPCSGSEDPLETEHPRVSRSRFPADDLRDPGARMLGVSPLLTQVRLPESVQ